MGKIHCYSRKLYKHMYIMYVHVRINPHICLLDSLFSFACCIRFKLFACAFKALKYSDSDFISVTNVCFLLGCLHVWNSLLSYYLEETNYITPNTSKLLQNH